MTCNCNNSVESNVSTCSDTLCPTCGVTAGTCGCTAGVAASAAPYYNQAAGCQESHVQVRVQNQYVTGLPVANSFNLPNCGQRVTLTVPGLQLITIGTYLWKPGIGYLKVISFDYATSTIVVENECQDGNAAPGTAVPACSLFTVVDAPIGIDNPCTNDAVATGTIVVCNNGIMQPLDATAAGQVPVSLDAGTNEVEFQTVDIPPSVCTELTADLNLIIGNAGPYNITVATTNIFALGDLIRIGGRSDRFTVTNIINITTFTATVTPAPVGMDTIPAGTSVCLAPCCEIINNWIDNPSDWDISDRFRLVNGESNNTSVAGAFLPVNTRVNGSITTVILPNYSTKNMLYLVTFDYAANIGLVTVAASEWIRPQYYPDYAVNLCAIGANIHGALVPTVTNSELEVWCLNKTFGTYGPPLTIPEMIKVVKSSYSKAGIIPPNQEVVLDARFGMAWDAGSPGPADTSLYVARYDVKVSALGVAF